MKNPFRSKICVYILVGSVLALTLQSCVPEGFDVKGSVDRSNEHEGGPSRTITGDDLGFNVSCGVLSGMPKDFAHSNLSNNESKASFSDNLGIYSQLEYIRKGSKFADATTHLSYITLSGNLVYKYKLANESMLFGGLGPYIGYGLGGTASGNGFSEPVFTGQGAYKRFDAGLNLVGQYRLPSTLSFGLDYEFGILNKSSQDDYTSRNRSLSLNVGYSVTKLLKGGKK